MYQRTLQKLQFGNLFQAVEHRGTREQPLYYSFGARLKKGELECAFAKAESSFEKSCAHLKKERQVYVIVNNDEVLLNLIPNNGQSPRALVASAFPDIKLDEFYYEVLIAETSAIVSMCRKEVLNALIEKYRKKSFCVIGWSIGITGIGQLQKYLADNTYTFQNYQWDNKQGKITSISEGTTYSEPRLVRIEEMEVEGEYLLALSGAVRSYVDFLPQEFGNFDMEISSQRASFIQQQYFKKGKLAAVFLLLLIAISNVFLFRYYKGEIESIEVKSTISKQQQANVTERALRVQKRKKRFEDVIENSSSRVSFYIDRILDEIPLSIALEKIAYQPLIRKVKAKKLIELEENSIRIVGTAVDKDDLSNWVSVLEEHDFVNTIEMKIEKERNKEFFTLDIDLK